MNRHQWVPIDDNEQLAGHHDVKAFNDFESKDKELPSPPRDGGRAEDAFLLRERRSPGATVLGSFIILDS